MIQRDDIIRLFQQMYKEHWSYEWGAASKGCVDCSGALVYAYRQLAGKSVIHGSNGQARRWISGSMMPISMAEPGMVAFKARKPGEEDYDLPERYREHGASYTGDLMDYYHVGLVDEDPRYVLNAKSTKAGFCRDQLAASNGWDFVAYLRDVEYPGGSEDKGKGEKMMQAVVSLPSGAAGSTVNMRERAMTSAPLICRVPVGSVVDVLTDQGTWCKIDYIGKQGWMMSNYLEYGGQEGEAGGDPLTEAERAKIEAALVEIEKSIEIIRETLGRG